MVKIVDRAPLYPCPYCKGDFNINDLIDHIKMEHPNWHTMPGLCPVCDRRLEIDMVPHIIFMHQLRLNNERQQPHSSSNGLTDENHDSLPSMCSSSVSLTWQPNLPLTLHSGVVIPPSSLVIPSRRAFNPLSRNMDDNVTPPSSFAVSSASASNPFSRNMDDNVTTPSSFVVSSTRASNTFSRNMDDNVNPPSSFVFSSTGASNPFSRNMDDNVNPPASFVVSSTRASNPFSHDMDNSTWSNLLTEITKEEKSSNENTDRNVREHPTSEQEYTEKTNKSKFVQQLLISKIFGDDD